MPTVEVILAYASSEGVDAWACCLCKDEPIFNETEIKEHLITQHKRHVKESALTYGVLIEHMKVPHKYK